MLQETTLSESFNEVVGLQSKLRTLAVKAVTLDAHCFSGSVSSIVLGDITIEIMRTCPVLLIGAAAEGRTGCLLVLEGTQDAHWDGRPVDPHDIALLESGLPFAAAYRDACACAFVSAGTDEARSLLLPPGDAAARRHGPVPVRRANLQAHGRVATIIRAAEQAAVSTPDVLRSAEARRSLRASLLDATGQLLAPAGTTDRSRRRRVGARHRIVREADEYLCTNLMQPVYTEDLCAALGVSASGLHDAFHATFGISPHRYLKLRRMSLVRAVLLSRSGPWHSVKAAALSHGFWHLGQFAHDYRAIYGEVPCETLARARWGITGEAAEDDGRHAG